MTPAEIAEIAARWSAATPGPWEARTMGAGDDDAFGEIVHTTSDDRFIVIASMQPVDAGDATAIAHAPQDVAALLGDVGRLDAEVARMREVLRAIEWMGPGARTKAENGPLQGDRCPYCHHAKEIGHHGGCILDRSLSTTATRGGG